MNIEKYQSISWWYYGSNLLKRKCVLFFIDLEFSQGRNGKTTLLS